MKSIKIRNFRKTLRKFERINLKINQSCCPGISMAQCQVLLEIAEMGEATTVELADIMRLDKSTLSRTIHELVKKDLVARKAHPSDRRYTILLPTGKGKKLSEAINRENDAYYLNVFSAVSFGKLDDMLHKFALLVDIIGQREIMRNKNDSCCT